jgi:nucleotide-binding universal stress UspA family protein
MGLIIVGVDHSAGAKEALRFAVEEAQFRQATLRVIHAWQFSSLAAPGIERSLTTSGGELGELRHVAEAALDATIQEFVGAPGDVEIERRVDQGAPAAVLVEESRGADLLVVGSRGHGGFAQLLLGSVSQQCALHAECPVVIVRASSGKSGERS